MNARSLPADGSSSGAAPATPLHTSLRACARALRDHRDEAVRALIAGAQAPKDNRFDDPPEIFKRRVAATLDLLIGHLEGREDFAALYAGQRNYELFQLERSLEDNLQASRRSVAEDGAVLRAVLAPRVDANALAAFEAAYATLTAGLVKQASQHVRTLFIGDCLIGETLSFLVGPLMDEGLSIEPFPINPHDPVQLRQALASLATKRFDVVFFSPFSHARVPELEALMDPARAFMPRAELEALVGAVLDQTRALLDELARRFECPIYVHNAALVPRARSTTKASARLMLTHRLRKYAGQRINQWLADCVALHNTSNFRHLFVLDELALVREQGRRVLGQFLNASPFMHATAFSRRLASEYLARIGAVGQLLGRKLVVCDLDNTLWDGLIGEGPVTHFADRQRSLKALKDHAGVVLSIASKNEPANVHFDGGVLALGDFVAPQISWNPKGGAVAKIKSTLNLQTRHMVFLDDRADERALVREAFPDLLTLDPCEAQTWARIDLWAALAHGSSDLDRTRLYQEQALRDVAIGPVDEDAPVPADSAVLEKLGLVISIRPAQRGDLKRVAELINRTNQWNLCASRTSVEQVRAWHDSDAAHVMLASAADRFGDMGTVCVAVVTEADGQAEIAAFVLSCRVFGYGVESAMLAELGRRCDVGGRNAALMGRFRSNTQNHPCRNMYPDHGFTAEGDAFRWSGTPPLPALPWAEVRVS